MTEILPDLLVDGLALVFCGTAASEVSARAGAYYANPGNHFWTALFAAGITPRLFQPSEFPDLLELRIGLTDLVKGVSGSDRDLKQADFDPAALSAKIERYQPHILAFTSKTACMAWKGRRPDRRVSYGWQDETIGKSRLFVLPSPSGAARRYWNLSYWKCLAAEYHLRIGEG